MKNSRALNVLAFDTTTSWQSIAVCRGPIVATRLNCFIPSSHSTTLMINIDQLLKTSHMTIHDIDLIATSTGPGSFTGLRIGLTTAKSLAFGLGCPLVGLPSLESMAAGLLSHAAENSFIIPVIDARHSEVYFCTYKKKNGAVQQVSEITVSPIEQLVQSLPEDVVICGTGALTYRHDIEQVLSPSRIMTEETSLFPQAEIMAQLARERYNSGLFDDPVNLGPLYIRPPAVRMNQAVWTEKKE